VNRQRWTSLTRVIPVAIVAAMVATFPVSTAALAQEAPTVALVPSDTYGTLLTDPSGWTLYTWDGDAEGASNCYGDCAAVWPPYTIDGDLVPPDGLPGSLGVIERDDGSWQVTLDNWPLYYFSGDQNPGDTNGDGSLGFGAQWYATAFAAPAEAAPAPPPAPQQPYGYTPPPAPPPPAARPTPPPGLAAQPANIPPQAPSARPAVPVTIANFQFRPPTLNISVGDTVTWTNNDSTTHTATADNSAWDSGRLAPGQSYSMIFNNPGSFTYHCSIHPNMRGSIVVSAGAPSGQYNPNTYSPNPYGEGPFYNSPGEYGPNVPPPPYDQYGAPIPPQYPPYGGQPPYAPPPPGAGNYLATLTVVAPPGGNISLTWIATPGAQSYRIYQTTISQPLNFSVVQTVPQTTGTLATNATVANLTPGQTYLFQVRAVDPNGLETVAPAAAMNLPGFGSAILAPPSGVTATNPTGTSLTVTWAATPGAASYRVAVSTNPNGPFTTAAGGTVTGTTATITGLTPNTTYYIQVIAMDNAGNQSTPSITATASSGPTVAAPTNVSVTAVTSTTATLTWTAAPNAATYRVTISLALSGPYSTATVTNSSSTGATVTGLSPSTPYFFQVYAVDNAGNQSLPSNTANAITTSQ